MKFKLLPLAIGAAIAMPGLALADAPTVYGKLNVTFENVDVDDGSDSADNWQVISNASRLGVKGKEKINDSLNAVYQLEYEVFVDDGDKGGQTFTQRNIFGGLSGSFGEVIVGKFDTPLKVAQGKIDQFNDLSGDIKHLVKGENRQSNIIQYSTPQLADAIVAKIAVMPGEEVDDGSTDDANDGIADHISASVAFDKDGLYAALAIDDDVNGWDATRLVGGLKMGMFEAGALYQMAEEADGDTEQNGLILSGAIKVGSGKIKGQLGTSTEELKGTEDKDITQIAFGYDHGLSKQTKLFAYINRIKEEQGDAEETNTNFGVGMEHKF